MKQQEIQERNEQIAIMMGLQPLTKPYLGAYQTTSDTYNPSFYHDRMEGESWYVYPKYDSDYNWLMDAVEFINKTHNDGNPYRDLQYTIEYLLHGGWWGETKIPRRLLSDITQIFLAVSDFAKLYNNI
jgi:hypothetical protein